MNESIVAIVLSIMAFLGIAATAYFGYKGTKNAADKQTIQELRDEIRELKMQIHELNETIAEFNRQKNG